MTMKTIGAALFCAAFACGTTAAQAGDMGMQHGHKGHGMQMQKGHMMHGHGPIGVMGRHVMAKGKFMLTYRVGSMDMSGLRWGTTDITADYAATSIPNTFAGMPGMPATLRVIPEKMSMTMHMFGAMYGLTDSVSLMAMVPYVEKEMTMITYQGPAGTTVLGRSDRSSEGIGDLRLSATFNLFKEGRTNLNGSLGLSLPTGSISETGQMLTPMGMQPVNRLGYNMQLGSGTVDLLPALTYQSGAGKLAWGAQLRGTIRMGTNDAGYALGDEVALGSWVSYKAAPWVSLSGRVEATRLGRIEGRDPLIMGPAPGANPDFIGGDSVTVFAGADFSPRKAMLKGHKIGIELGVPIYQELNGPMLKTDWRLGLAWRKGF